MVVVVHMAVSVKREGEKEAKEEYVGVGEAQQRERENQRIKLSMVREDTITAGGCLDNGPALDTVAV